MLRDGLELSDIKSVSPKSYKAIKNAAREMADVNGSALDAYGFNSKSELPTLNREEYYKDTLGSVRNKNNRMRVEDVPSSMRNRMNNKRGVGVDNDTIMREAGIGKDTDSLSDMYEAYENLAELPTEVYTPDNIDNGLKMLGEDKKVTQDVADSLFGNKRDLKVKYRPTTTKDIKVGRKTADLGVEDAVAEAPTTTSPALDGDIAELKSRIGGNGGSGVGGGTATQLPGSDGFNVKLKEGKTTDIKLTGIMTTRTFFIYIIGGKFNNPFITYNRTKITRK
jgi:hypothetical protein